MVQVRERSKRCIASRSETGSQLTVGVKSMSDEKKREAAEALFRDERGSGTDGQDALSREAERRASLINNMHRLRALRLATSKQELGSSA